MTENDGEAGEWPCPGKDGEAEGAAVPGRGRREHIRTAYIGLVLKVTGLLQRRKTTVTAAGCCLFSFTYWSTHTIIQQ